MVFNQEIEHIRKSAFAVVQFVLDNQPGKSEDEQKQYCEKTLLTELKDIENLVPYIRTIVNIPILDNVIDRIEEHAIQKLVEWAWKEFVDRTQAQAQVQSHA